MPQLALKFARSIDERFADFLRLNPHVYEAFAAAARRLRAAGHRRYSAKGIVEWLRFEAALQTTRTDDRLINNDFTSRLARKLIDEDKTFAGFFETRKIRSE